jgi:hypothetical protein
MPRRTPDEGVKPFEFRVGIGGLPTLGGIFRAGDPATIPPYKHHLIVNMRITPSGMIVRPGFETIVDTGVDECIDGLTGGGEGRENVKLVLWPGSDADAPNGVGNNVATFRRVFQGDTGYSEYVFVMYGTPDSPNVSPVVALDAAQPPPLEDNWATPFIFRERACILAKWEAVPAILGLNMPKAAGWEASDCLRSIYQLGESYSGSGAACPDPSGTPQVDDPIGAFPRRHPIGAIDIVSLCQLSLFSGDAWTVCDIAVRPERFDEPLTAEAGVADVLYLAARTAGGKAAILRFDGVSWTIEHSLTTQAAQQEVRLGVSKNGLCYFASDDAGVFYESGSEDEDGVWTATVDGVRAGGGDLNFRPQRLIGFAGDVIAVGQGTGYDGGPPYPTIAAVNALVIATWSPGDTSWALLGSPVTNTTGIAPLAAEILGADLYVYTVGTEALVDDESLWIFDARDGSINDVIRTRLTNTLNDYPAYTGAAPEANTYTRARWMQQCGSRIYFGGMLDDWDIINQAVDDGFKKHSVFDVTDFNAPERVYEVREDSLRNESSFDYMLSMGALPAIPASGDQSSSEGFLG